ncbi:MAG: B12 binding domain protein [Firmicutes bacterium ADurb.Bin248]|nr:MAG: B12 binding domain protein [Firmicutes bacterium ADurb.Bin248]HOG00932.1 cobalamin B12-binding domain-containing protein [Clostridia bacterium]HPK15311.1 cobalamin B12-binding domain-containing protein [Clostridia bacterium]
MKKGLVMAGSLGNCVHVAGAAHFLNLAEDEGYETLFLGPANSVDSVISKIRARKPAMVSLGYRLTPANVIPLARELIEKSKNLAVQPVWIFAGTRPVAREVEKLGFFDVVFDGAEDIDECIMFLRTGARRREGSAELFAQSLTDRIRQKKPYPLLRHHFGLPDFEDTRAGVAEIAESRVLDVISLGIDQNTQQFFFAPEKRDPRMDGAGGVPVRSAGEFARLREASRCGNYPLMRCYSGTADVIRLAEVLRTGIDNAWCAVPLCWYNELDGRGTRKVEEAMRESQSMIRWHGERNIPVELNEPHHWGLRDAHDTISVAMSFLSAYNAKKYGAKDYVAQYMFNIPSSMSFSMDLAKALAQIEMSESVADAGFRVYREVRAGLPFLNGDPDIAKGQLAASTANAMNVAPHIIHVVGYSEAERAATPEIVIESCKIVRGVVRSTLYGNADAAADPRVQARKNELIDEANCLLAFIREEYGNRCEDPWGDAAALSDCIRRGILDAPHIVKNAEFRGDLATRIHEGKCLAYDGAAGRFLNERERLARIREREGKYGSQQNRSH